MLEPSLTRICERCRLAPFRFGDQIIDCEDRRGTSVVRAKKGSKNGSSTKATMTAKRVNIRESSKRWRGFRLKGNRLQSSKASSLCLSAASASSL
jgi:hypothetical protein